MTASNKRFSVGNYYNWSAAIASDNSSSLTTSTYNDVNNNPQNSICPKGWRLPTISSQGGSIANSTNEFGRLNILYNENKTSVDVALISKPLYLVRSGEYNSSGLISSGSNGMYQSSTARNHNGNFYLGFSKSGVSPESSYANSWGRNRSWSIRCLAR